MYTFFGKYYITRSSMTNTGNVQSWYAARDRHILWRYRLTRTHRSLLTWSTYSLRKWTRLQMVHSVMQDIHFPHSVLSKCRNGFTVYACKKSAFLSCTGFLPLSPSLILNCTQIGQYIWRLPSSFMTLLKHGFHSAFIKLTLVDIRCTTFYQNWMKKCRK
jgi:hypothetical protein